MGMSLTNSPTFATGLSSLAFGDGIAFFEDAVVELGHNLSASRIFFFFTSMTFCLW